MRVTHVHSISVFVESFEQVKEFYTEILTLPFGASTSGLRSLYVGTTALVLLNAGTEDRRLVGRPIASKNPEAHWEPCATCPAGVLCPSKTLQAISIGCGTRRTQSMCRIFLMPPHW